MDQALLVLLVEDDPVACREMVECMESREDISLVSVTNNARRAAELIQDFHPDALILDLELHQGGETACRSWRTCGAWTSPGNPTYWLPPTIPAP